MVLPFESGFGVCLLEEEIGVRSWVHKGVCVQIRSVSFRYVVSILHMLIGVQVGGGQVQGGYWLACL